MSEHNTTAAQAPAEDTATAKADDLAATIFADRDAAQAAITKTMAKNTRPMEVTKNGTVLGWMLAAGYGGGLAALARKEGYSLSAGKTTAPPTREQVQAAAVNFTDDEWKALLAARKAAKAK
jgi:hypothetical protein